MTAPRGRFAWHELMTTDPAAATAFYSAVVGWEPQRDGVAGVDYTLLMAGGIPAAGLMAMPEGAPPMPPHWLGYVAVDDVDAAVIQATGLGGRVLAPARSLAGVGRFAVIADPQGAAIALFRGETEAPPPPPMAPGFVGWNELYANDMPAAFAFYAALFGWTEAETMQIPEAGPYRIFAHAGAGIGGMVTRPPQVPGPFWIYYFAVPDIDAAVARVEAAGGTLLLAPMEVPGGAWVIQAMDPQGAAFALVGARAG